MLSKYKHKNVTWIDLENAQENELSEITEEYKIPAQTRPSDTEKPHEFICFEKDGIAKICLPFSFEEESENDDLIDFILGDNFLITSRSKEIPALTSISRDFENESIGEKGKVGQTPSFLFSQILKKLYKDIHEKLKEIKKDSEKIEKMISNGRGRYAVDKIWSANKKLIKLKKMMKIHENAISSLKNEVAEMLGFDATSSTGEISKEHDKIKSEIKHQKRILKALNHRNTAYLLVKNGERLKTISITLFGIAVLAVSFLLVSFSDALM